MSNDRIPNVILSVALTKGTLPVFRPILRRTDVEILMTLALCTGEQLTKTDLPFQPILLEVVLWTKRTGLTIRSGVMLAIDQSSRTIQKLAANTLLLIVSTWPAVTCCYTKQREALFCSSVCLKAHSWRLCCLTTLFGARCGHY